MTERGAANEVMARRLAEDVAFVAIEKFHQQNPDRKLEIPAALKLWGTVAAAVLTFVIVGVMGWMATTLNALQITVARIDERQQQDATGQRVTDNSRRIEKLDERVTRLEQSERKGT